MWLGLWAGLLLWTGFLSAPTLFSALADRHAAGAVAGRLFADATWMSVLAALGTVLLLPATVGRRGSSRLLALAPAALLLLNELAVRPLLTRAAPGGGGAFALWHGVSVALYLAATLNVCWLWWQAEGGD